MKTVCIIQARRQSTRFADKIFHMLNGKPILQHVVERCKRIRNVEQVIIAAPDDPYEDIIEDLAGKLSVLCYRGPMDDVLTRYWGASQLVDSDLIMRVTADCPLIDPVLCEMLVKRVQLDFVDYGTLQGWPHGLDCEVFTRDCLNLAYDKASLNVDREHVTLWLKKQENLKILTLTPEEGENYFSDYRWVVDYPEDYEFMKELFSSMPENVANSSWFQVLEFIKTRPDLGMINAHCSEDWANKTTQIIEKSHE